MRACTQGRCDVVRIARRMKTSMTWAFAAEFVESGTADGLCRLAEQDGRGRKAKEAEALECKERSDESVPPDENIDGTTHGL